MENVVDGQNHINEYFNSYFIIKEVATKNPELIYDEWNGSGHCIPTKIPIIGGSPMI